MTDIILTNQGTFSSSYTAWLSEQFDLEAVRSYFLEEKGVDIGDSSTWIIDIAQNSETGVPWISNVGLTQQDFEILFANSTKDLFSWTSGGAKNTVTHERYYFDEFNFTYGDENQPPTADPIVLDPVTETVKLGNEDWTSAPDTLTVDLLGDASAVDPDGDPLSIVDGSVKLENGDDLPEYITYENAILTIDKNHPSLDSLHLDDISNVVIKYSITDGTHTIENTASFDITGTADQFFNEDSQTETKTVAQATNSAGQQTINDVFVIAETSDSDNFNFSGTITGTALGDYDAGNETAEVSGEFAAFTLEDGGPNTTELLTTALGPTTVVLDADAFDGGQVDYSVDWHQSVQAGSTVTLAIDYSWWA